MIEDKPVFEIKHADFVTSAAKVSQIPEESLPEFAFIGRSNVGKSSLINSLTNKKKLAAISKTPGKTKLINYFIINKSIYFVDLPGYGFAKVSKKERDRWSKLIYDYLEQSAFLTVLFLLFDSRRGLKDSDIQMINTLNKLNIPICFVATKRDKLSGNEWKKQYTKIKKQFSDTDIQIFPYSSTKMIGKNDLLNVLAESLGVK